MLEVRNKIDKNLVINKNLNFNKLSEIQRENVVIILWGQSNQQGAAKLSNMPPRLNQDNLNYSYIWDNTSFEKLTLDNNGHPSSAVDFGAELELAYQLEKNYNKRVYVIKYAIGGTALVERATESDWNISSSEIYPNAINSLQNALNYLDSILDNYTILGMDWMQGERDSTLGVTESDYYTAISNLTLQLRTDLSIPSLPVTLNEINPDATGYADSINVTNALQTLSSEDTDIHFITQPTSGFIGDGLHYNADSQSERANSILNSLPIV